MTTGMLIEFSGMNDKTYDRINEALNLSKNLPKGLLFHTAGPVPGGFRVFDIWESKELFEQFQKQRLENALKQVGYTQPPSRHEFFPIHNALAPQPNLLTKLSTTVSSR